MQYSLREVIAAAIYAQDINGTYVRKNDYHENGLFPNSQIMVGILSKAENFPELTEEYMAKAEKIVEYLSYKVMDLIAGNLEDYWRTAVLLLEQPVIIANDYRTLGYVASLPASYANSVAREKLMNQMKLTAESSRHFGSPGDKFPIQPVKIMGSFYSKLYNKHYHTAVTQDNNMIRFPLNTRIENDETVIISSKIHKHGENNTTVLHYVKVHKKPVDSETN